MTDRKEIDIEIINAWAEASQDLGVQIKTPFILELDEWETIESILLVENFGSKLGTLVFSNSDWIANPKIKSSGYGISTLGDTYRKYDRNLFIDTLNDWGYSGDSKSKPSWYTGQFWGQEK